MIKRILLTAMVLLLSGGLLGSYFYFAGKLDAAGRSQSRCQRIRVFLPDSLETAIVEPGEVERFVSHLASGRVTDSIDLDTIERALRSRGEVMTAQVYISSPEEVSVRITQRKPVVRFDNGHKRFYADREGYIFPVHNAVDVPVVTGNIPLAFENEYRGPVPEQSAGWVEGVVALARYIDGNTYLSREIAQIDVESPDELVLYTRTEGPRFLFGNCDGLEDKFRKMDIYWRNIAPEAEREEKHYSTINLKYNNQIICK